MFLNPKGKYSSKQRVHSVHNSTSWSSCGKIHGSDKRYELSNKPSIRTVCQLCYQYNNYFTKQGIK